MQASVELTGSMGGPVATVEDVAGKGTIDTEVGIAAGGTEGTGT
jgi:hypothetical protein